MNSFEQVVASLLFQEGYWVFQGFKVKLEAAEKKSIGRSTSPRWELDLIAYKANPQTLLVVECKSYLDSNGVKASEIISDNSDKSRYKLFVDSQLRSVVFHRLVAQLAELGLVNETMQPTLALAAGKIRNKKDKYLLHDHFTKNDWVLFDTQWIVSRLITATDQSYFDSVQDVVSKLIVRNKVEQGAAANP